MNIPGKINILCFLLCFGTLLFSSGDANIINDLYFETDTYQNKFANRKITSDISSTGDKAGLTARLLMKSVWIYKDYISPQDLDVCTFYPSCSEYAFLALKSESFPEAVLDAGDRLMRCYDGNHIYYDVDLKYNKSIDFPDTAKFRK